MSGEGPGAALPVGGGAAGGLKRLKRDSDSQNVRAASSKSARVATSGPSRSNKALIAAVAAMLIVVGLVAWYWQKRPLASIAFQRYNIARLTTTGSLQQASISRDGHFLVYAAKESEHYSLWVHQIATSTNVRVIGPMPRGNALWGARFSPDGTYIYFLQNDDKSESASLYRLPAVGGTPVKVISRIAAAGGISPDGSRIIYYA